MSLVGKLVKRSLGLPDGQQDLRCSPSELWVGGLGEGGRAGGGRWVDGECVSGGRGGNGECSVVGVRRNNSLT